MLLLSSDLAFVILGVIIGLFIAPNKTIVILEKPTETVSVKDNPNNKTQFLDPVTNKEKFDNANNIGDLLE